MKKYIYEISKHSFVYTAAIFLTKASGLLLIPVYARFLSTSEYGIVANVVAIINFFSILYVFGMESAWSRLFFDYADKSDDQKILFGNIVIFLSILGFILSILLTIWGEPLFKIIIPDLPFRPYIVLGIWTAYFGVFFTLKRTLFRVRQQSVQFGIISLGRFLTTMLLIIVAVVLYKLGAYGKVMAEFTVWFIFMLISIYLLKKDIKLKIDFYKLKQSLKYAAGVLPHTIAASVVNVIDKVIITNIAGMAVTGIFSVGFQFGSIMQLITYSINLAWAPFFMKTAQKLGNDAKSVFSKLTTNYLLVIIFVGMLITYFSKEMVLILTTKKYINAVPLIPIYIFTFVINGMYFMMATKIFYVKKAVKYIAVSTITAAIINVVLNILLIPKIGMIGAAWARFISTFTLFLVAYYISQHFYYIKYEIRKIFKLLIITAGFIAIYYYFNGFVDFNFFMGIIIKSGVLISFLLIAYWSGLFSTEQIKSFFKTIKK